MSTIQAQTITTVLLDGSTPAQLERKAQTLRLYRGDDNRINFQVLGESAAPVPIAGGGAVFLGIKRRPFDAVPLYSFQATLTSPSTGSGYFIIPRTVLVLLTADDYTWDVVLVDDIGQTAHLVDQSGVQVIDTAYVAGSAVTPPAPTTPLGQAWLQRGLLTFTELSGVDFQDVDLTALGLAAGSYMVMLTVYNAEATTPVNVRVTPRGTDPAYPAGMPAGGFRVKLDVPSDCTIFYSVEAL